MNKIASSALALTILITGCSSDNSSPFLTGSASSATNIASAGNFSISFSDPNPNVLEFTAPPAASPANCADLTTIYDNVTSTITVRAADNQGAAVSGVVVTIQVEWGTLDANTCTLSNGSCSVEWSSNTNIDRLTSANDTDSCLFGGTGTVSIYNSVTAWAYGEEFFLDNDGDEQLSDAETFNDIDEPYLDRNDNGSFDAATDNLTDADTDGVHSGPDGLFNGPSCDTGTRADCGTGALIPIYESTYLVLGF